MSFLVPCIYIYMRNSNTLCSHPPNMDISSFSFLSPEDFCSISTNPWFQDLDNGFNKRRKKEDDSKGGFGNGCLNEEGLKKSGFGDILASLLLLEAEAKQEEAEWMSESQQEKALFESNHKRKVQAMNEFYDQLQQHYSETVKPSWKSVSALAATVATTSGNDTTTKAEVAVAGGQQRRLWVKDRSKDWWDRCNHQDFPEEELRKAFRMSKSTFGLICRELEPVVMKKNTMLRDAIPVRQRVAVCIWRLATGEPLRLVSKRFGLGISTCHKLVLEVCSAINNVLMPKFLQWQRRTEVKLQELPMVLGACCVLHNICETNNEDMDPELQFELFDDETIAENNLRSSNAVLARDNIAHNLLHRSWWN